MDDLIYYDEDLFFLNEIIRTIENATRLDLQPGLFLDKIVDDIMFVENTLAVLYGTLMENEHLMHRPDHLDRLARTESRFAEVLEEVLRGGHSLDSEIAPFYPRFGEMSTGQRDRVAIIKSVLRETVEIPRETSDVVSEQEIRFLLMEEKTEEKQT